MAKGGTLTTSKTHNQTGEEMRQLNNQEVNQVSGGSSYGPTLKQVVSSAVESAIPYAVGSAIGLTLRNTIGWSDYSTNEIAGYAALGGLTYIGGFVAAYAYCDPDVLSR